MPTENRYTSILTLIVAPWLLYACSSGGGADAAGGGRGGSGWFLGHRGHCRDRRQREQRRSNQYRWRNGERRKRAEQRGPTRRWRSGERRKRTEQRRPSEHGWRSGERRKHRDRRCDNDRWFNQHRGRNTQWGNQRRITSGGGSQLTVAWMRPARLYWERRLAVDGGVDAATGGSSGGSRPDAGADRATGGPTPERVRPQGERPVRLRRSRTSNYAGTSSASQTLDLLLPANALLPLPLVVRIHGGGFSSGDKAGEETGTAASGILAKGYALASVNYRLSGQALFPAGVQDVKAAVRWLRAHAAQYGLDSDRFASWANRQEAICGDARGDRDQTTVFDDDSLGNPGVGKRSRGCGGLVWPS